MCPTDKVSVIYGANDLELELVGQKVGEIHKSCADVLNLSDDAFAVVNGVQVTADYVMVGGDRLEFKRPPETAPKTSPKKVQKKAPNF